MPQTQYAQLADFYAIYPQTLFAGTAIGDTQVTAALVTASAVADSYMRGRFNLPITGSNSGGVGVFDPSIVIRVCHIAAYNLMSGRGFNPAPEGEKQLVDRYFEAVGYPNQPGSGWFPQVQRQAIHPDVIETASGGPAHPFPSFTSARPRGWR